MGKRYLDIYASHFGKIMSNYAIVGLSAMLLILVGTIVSAMISVLCVMFGILLIFATLGLVLVTNKNFISEMFNSGSHLLEITTSLYRFFSILVWNNSWCVNNFTYCFMLAKRPTLNW